MDRLADYRRKRDASRTPEPVPAADSGPEAGAGDEDRHAGDAGAPLPRFVVQEHHARRLHWDFRLERDGVLVSWALPKGVPDDPAVNHLAVHTEDHPLEYGGFEGRIPRGEYGAGSVTIWDHGTYETGKWDDREVKVVLHGQRLSGGYVLFRTGNGWMIHRERMPLPVRLIPMLATTSRQPPTDGQWALEMKWDGVRALAFIEGGRPRLVSRTSRDITQAYPELAGMGTAIGHRQVLLDGEIVAFGDGGWPEFEALQQRIHVTSAAQAARLATENPVTYLAFDLLQLDGRPLMGRPYSERREMLEDLMPNGPYWQCPPVFPGDDFAAVRAASVEHGLEGVVAKRLDSRYEPGERTGSWRKIKNSLRQEVVVAGWKPGKGNRAGQIGSLLVGINTPHGTPKGLVYAGHVGTGFTVATLRMLGERLAPLRRRDSPFTGPVPPEHARPAVWVEPRLVIDVTFEGWTRAGRMRAPAYKGLRGDKDPAEVVREP
ncbi:MAG: non-homologous end-joining DNA ligase [Streptosporangiaceae bacterium]|nr:non-homologous end-joining DNA ligase [Streptosporangiaceae bacterium]